MRDKKNVDDKRPLPTLLVVSPMELKVNVPKTSNNNNDMNTLDSTSSIGLKGSQLTSARKFKSLKQSINFKKI